VQITNLSVLCYAQGFTLWHYRADVGELYGRKNHFKDAKLMFHSGDWIIVTGDSPRLIFVRIADEYVYTHGVL
jgi:hypothetical protein